MYVYLFPLLFPAGGLFNWRSCPPVPNPAEAGLDTPNVKPADAVMPGLLKLNPDVLELPKPYVQGRKYSNEKLNHKNKYKIQGWVEISIWEYTIYKSRKCL